jgi:hypothetical protein
MLGRERVICPQCGAENPKSIIVTTCHQCRGSLQAAQPAPPDSPPPPPLLIPRTGAIVVPPPPPPPRPAVVPPPRPVVMPPEPVVAPRTPSRPPVPPAPAPAAAPPTAGLGPPSAEDLARELKRMLREGPGIALVVAVAVALFLSVVISHDSGRFASGLVLPVLVLAVVLVARAWVTASTYAVTVDPAPGPAMVGDTIAWGVRIVARRPLTLQAGTVTVRCQEHAIVSSGKSTAHYRRPIYERRYSVGGRALAPGEEFEVRPALEIPPSAIPSHDEHNHRVEWTVELVVPSLGFCAGIREKVRLLVAPRIVEAGHSDDTLVPAGWLAAAPIVEGRPGRITLGGVVGSTGEKLRGITVMRDGLTVALETTDGVASDYGPVVPAGTTRELKLTLEAQEPVHCRGLLVWIGCMIGGKGHGEKLALCKEESVYAGDLLPGRPIEAPIRLVVPPTAPVTYFGSYVRFQWVVRVRVDIPVWRDRTVELPFVVTPQAVPP